ncbi:zinc ribbon domain-containing protein [Allobaculum sp. Allo2]|nr:zinc ribbon domain-containing protein [Allobaculum sp. Allo2]
MKYCEHCHAPISDTALFCTSCGTPVSKSSPASQPAKSNPVQNASAQRVQPGKTVQPAKMPDILRMPGRYPVRLMRRTRSPSRMRRTDSFRMR